MFIFFEKVMTIVYLIFFKSFNDWINIIDININLLNIYSKHNNIHKIYLDIILFCDIYVNIDSIYVL